VEKRSSGWGEEEVSVGEGIRVAALIGRPGKGLELVDSE